ncbi:MAG TPA: polysaccharide deacetylase family protein [Candidatus Dormibacteraeota bacterium]|nr:polysaccharide deacetylase family protein [Candidatus Dormibacteraeota bacterium]
MRGAYGPFPYSPIVRRPRLRWPGGARLAVWVIPNVEFFPLERLPDVMQWSVRDYGNRVGVFRLMQVLDRYRVRATVALNSDVCIHHPEIVEEGRARGWEFMGHNRTNAQRLTELESEEERRLIAEVMATIERATGERPRGWLSSGLQETPATLGHLVDAGCRYVCDWTNDDQPYAMTLDDGRSILSIPYTVELNDKPAFERHHRSALEFQEMICRQFDVLYREGEDSGRVMAIALHPYLIGVPHRIGALDAALEYVCRHDGVWLATGTEIADHFAATLPEVARQR